MPPIAEMGGVIVAIQQPLLLSEAIAVQLPARERGVINDEACLGLGAELQEQAVGGPDGLTVYGEQDTLPWVALDQPGQSGPCAMQVAVPGVGAGCPGPVGVGVGGRRGRRS